MTRLSPAEATVVPPVRLGSRFTELCDLVLQFFRGLSEQFGTPAKDVLLSLLAGGLRLIIGLMGLGPRGKRSSVARIRTERARG